MARIPINNELDKKLKQAQKVRKWRQYMSNSIQESLTSFYSSEIAALRQNNVFNKFHLRELSAPYLLSVPDAYFASNIKVMYVGKETNGWRGKFKTFGDFLADEHRVEKMQLRYDHEIANEPKWNNKFFIEYKKIRKALCANKKGSIVVNNLMKMDFKQKGKGYSRNSKDHSEQLSALSRRFFLKEVELLKPDFVIFATSHTYDGVMKSALSEWETVEVIEKKSLWKFRSCGAICYRTWHPQTIKYNALKTIPEYFDMIIEDIKSET